MPLRTDNDIKNRRVCRLLACAPQHAPHKWPRLQLLKLGPGWSCAGGTPLSARRRTQAVGRGNRLRTPYVSKCSLLLA